MNGKIGGEERRGRRKEEMMRRRRPRRRDEKSGGIFTGSRAWDQCTVSVSERVRSLRVCVSNCTCLHGCVCEGEFNVASVLDENRKDQGG